MAWLAEVGTDLYCGCQGTPWKVVSSLTFYKDLMTSSGRERRDRRERKGGRQPSLGGDGGGREG